MNFGDKATWQETINYVQTPKEVQRYLDDYFVYDLEEAFFNQRIRLG